jgi:hypothetical protein
VIKVDQSLLELLNEKGTLESLDSEAMRKRVKKIEFSQSIKAAGDRRRKEGLLKITH